MKRRGQHKYSWTAAPRVALILGPMAILPVTLFAGDSTVGRPLFVDDGSAVAASGGGHNTGELALELRNPIASFVRLPFKNSFDFGGGPNGDGFEWEMKFQPVVPFKLNDDWELIVRTILPVISQNDMSGTKADPSGSLTGLGDTTMNFFFSPIEPTSGGLVWGVGPALSIPTATDELLGSEQWAAGPSFVILKKSNRWTFGAIASHYWSFAGDDSRHSINQTSLQPFVAYTTTTHTTFGLTSESEYEWESSEWIVPIDLTVSQLVEFDGFHAEFELGARWYAEAPEEDSDWGLLAGVTFLF